MNRITERRWEIDTCTKEPARDKAETHEVQDGAQDGGAYIDCVYLIITLGIEKVILTILL